MSKLKKHKFSSLYAMSSGISSKPEQAGHGHPFLSFSNVFNNYFVPDNLNDLMNTSEKEQVTYSIKKGDIFLTRTSETIDELGMSCIALKDYQKATFSGFLKRLRPLQNNITHEKYLGFYLRSKFFRKSMTNNATMTLRASFNEDIFSYLNIYLPDYETQKSIGEFLFLLNSKIELNNRIMAELEIMAKTLYDYWFVQFDFPDKSSKPYKANGGKMVWNDLLKKEIPSGWKVHKIDEVLDVSLGGTPSTSNPEYWENGKINWLSSGEMSNFPIVKAESKITEEALNNSATKLMPKGTVAISITRYIRPTILAIDSCANQSVVGIHESSIFKSSYLYPFFINEVARYMVIRTGAMQPHINKETINGTLIIEPSDHVLEKYYKIATPIYQQIINNAMQNQELIQLRDWLLPMLMNGQVLVSK